jgi:hypothetical protein
LLYAIGVGDVHGPPSRGTPSIGDLSNHRIHLVLTEICNCDMGAFISEKVRSRTALPSTGTGNQHHSTFDRSTEFS